MQVAMFELTVFQAIFPLASAGLQAAALVDADLRSSVTFHKFSNVVDSPEVVPLVESIEADVYTFSCYVWNMGLVRQPRDRDLRAVFVAARRQYETTLAQTIHADVGEELLEHRHLGPRRSGLIRHDELRDQQKGLAGTLGSAPPDGQHRRCHQLATH
jgi:hypothetical protein